MKTKIASVGISLVAILFLSIVLVHLPLVHASLMIQNAPMSIDSSNLNAAHAMLVEPRDIQGKLEPWLWTRIRDLSSPTSGEQVPLIIRLRDPFGNLTKTDREHYADLLAIKYNATIDYVAEVLPILIVKIPVQKVMDVSAEYFVLHVGDGNERVMTCLNVSAQAIEARPNVWNLGFQGSGINISIIDTGIDKTHPDLRYIDETNVSKVILEHDFTGEGTTQDSIGHGTHVAGIAAGTGNYSKTYLGPDSWFIGMAPKAFLFNARVFNSTGYGLVSWVIEAIDWSVSHGAHVINLSLTALQNGDGTSLLSETCDDAVQHGVVVVVASNDHEINGDYPLGNPADAFNVITVGSVNDNETVDIADDVKSSFSGHGPTIDGRTKPDIVAPGAGIWSTFPVASGYAYKLLSGTSMAAPHIAGTAALLREAHPDWNPVMIKQALMETARLNIILQSLSENDRGKGIVDANASVSANPEAYPVSLRVDSISAVGTHYSVVEVYRNGTWKGFFNVSGGIPITMNYSVTVRREDSYSSYNVTARVGLRRVNVNNVSDYEDIPNTETNVTLQAGGNATVTLMWNETAPSRGHYSTMKEGDWEIYGYVWPVNSTYWDEVPSDNRKYCETVKARELAGDVNGDSVVDIYDAITLAIAYSSQPGSARWNPDADINRDDTVDVYDCILLANNWDKKIDYTTGNVATGASSGSGGGSSILSATAVTVDPISVTVFKDETFTVDVKISSVTDLYGWELELYWNNTLINCTNAVIHNPAGWNSASQYGAGLQNDYNSTSALYQKGVTAQYPEDSFNGSMSIVTLTFQPINAGPTSLMLQNVKLGNSSGLSIDHSDTSGSVTVYWGGYMRSDTKTVNGLNAYLLNATRTTTGLYQSANASEQWPVTWGIRAWVRHSNGTEQEITLDGQTGTPKAQVSRSSGYGMQSNTVSVTQRSMQATDSLVVRVYMDIGGGGWTQTATFTTEQLGATTLTGTTWTVYYYTSATYNRITDKTYGRYYWGSSAYDSRIQNLQYG